MDIVERPAQPRAGHRGTRGRRAGGGGRRCRLARRAVGAPGRRRRAGAGQGAAGRGRQHRPRRQRDHEHGRFGLRRPRRRPGGPLPGHDGRRPRVHRPGPGARARRGCAGAHPRPHRLWRAVRSRRTGRGARRASRRGTRFQADPQRLRQLRPGDGRLGQDRQGVRRRAGRAGRRPGRACARAGGPGGPAVRRQGPGRRRARL